MSKQSELEKRIKALEDELARLKAQPPQHYHYYYTYTYPYQQQPIWIYPQVPYTTWHNGGGVTGNYPAIPTGAMGQ